MNLHKNCVLVMKLIFLNLLSSSIFLIPSSSSSGLIEIDEYYSAERDGLLKLRDSVSSDSNLHANWSGPPCMKNSSRWAGIACSNWHVVHIVLEGIQLQGFLPPTFLNNITLLRKLSFRNNTLSGPLPNLTNLVHLEYVVLSYNRFWGSIPMEYTQLPNLQVLELQENYLDGQIPAFDQPTLRVFNVSYNHLEGPIPQTGALHKFPKTSYSHNSNLCGSPLEKSCPVLLPPPSPSPSSNVKKTTHGLPAWTVALIVAAAALFLFLLIFVFLCYYPKVHGKGLATNKQEQTATGGDGDGPDGCSGWTEKKIPHIGSMEDPEKRVELEFFDKEVAGGFDLDDLLRASAEVLGKGKLGTAYKVTLESGPVVVVKRLKNMNELSRKEFIQQIQLLGKMRHENLVQILSFYYSKEENLVIYNFVPSTATLFELLHENRGFGRVALDWATRLSIIKDIAKGVTFLHQSLPSHKVPHGNLKSSNVLLVIQGHSSSSSSSGGGQIMYELKLTDFGLLPLLPSRKHSETLAIGKSPEFAQGKKLSHKADVYCFGIILLEVITGRIPGELISPPGLIYNDHQSRNIDAHDDLSDWVRMVVNNDWSTDILDPEILAAKEDHDEMLKLTQIALDCTDMAPEKRPKMIQVLKRIHDIDPLRLHES